MSNYIDISGIEKGAVLAALFNNAKPVPGNEDYDPEYIMTDAFANSLLSNGTYFDFIQGRVLKISMTGVVIKQRLYNQYNGIDAAEKALFKLLHPKIGSSFESFLKEDGIFEEVDEAAKKRIKEIEEKDKLL